MKYMLLVYSPENAWTQEEWKACTEKSAGICHELQSRGEFTAASPLHPVACAGTVRVRHHKPIITGGPFAETAEQLGGFFLIDVPDLDAAIHIAARLPAAEKGTVEIRPVIELDTLPESHFEKLLPRSDSGTGEPNLVPYMLLCYDDQEHWKSVGEAEHRLAMEKGVAITRDLAEQSRFISAAPLQWTETATSVRMRGGKRIVTDGPFAETNEVLGGFYLILAKDLNDALSVASRHPGADYGSVEVRRVFQLSGLPDSTSQN